MGFLLRFCSDWSDFALRLLRFFNFIQYFRIWVFLDVWVIIWLRRFLLRLVRFLLRLVRFYIIHSDFLKKSENNLSSLSKNWKIWVIFFTGFIWKWLYFYRNMSSYRYFMIFFKFIINQFCWIFIDFWF